MRIRKRTPVRAASPGPPPPPPPPLLLPQMKGTPDTKGEEDEEKQGSLVVGGREEEDDEDEDLVMVASKNSLRNSAMDAPQAANVVVAGASRCSRNDGKRWRCKSAAAPGYVFCERHIAWSTRKRKPRPKKRSHSSILDTPAAKVEPTAASAKAEDDGGDGEEFQYYGGLQQGSGKRAKSGGG
uniref:WRC domain-containing protein n=1 Tax=Leersia perrieri TaxID=77586 RepID=A0A0D9XK57_9ORYZ